MILFKLLVIKPKQSEGRDSFLKTILKLIILLTPLLYLACSEDSNRRSKNSSNAEGSQGEGDAQTKATTELRILFPERPADFSTLVDAYYISLEPEGDDCTTTQNIEEFGTYEDDKSLVYSLDVDCDYKFDFLLGKKAAPATLKLAEEVTYDDVIKPIINRYCFNCHPEYGNYEETVAQEENILVQISNGFMPPEEVLSDFEVASFFGWKAGGFLESDPNPIPEDSPLNDFSAVYFRNNFNSFVYSFTLRSKLFVNYEDSLWVQDQGIDDGISTIEFPFLAPVIETEDGNETP